MAFLHRHQALVAAGLILLGIEVGWLLMPSIMHLVSGGGPIAGVAVALAFILSLFAVLWLRARQQRRHSES